MAMKVKRFEASTMREAIMKVKRELGSEAVILHTRKYDRPEFFGLRRRNFVEIIAGTDIPGDGNTATKSNGAAARPSSKKAAPTPRQKSAASSHNNETQEVQNLKKELSDMKNSLQALLQQRQQETTESNVSPYPRIFGDIYLKLVENEVDEVLAQDIIRSLDGALDQEAKEDEKAVYSALGKQLRRLIKVSGAINLASTAGQTKTVAFVGPTGVGKTTTVAKLATIFSLSQRKKVGIVTSDTMRIAAVEQIKVYSDIIGVPVQVVYNADDMKHAMDYFSDRDLVLIDTAGHSHWDTERINEIRDILAVCYPLELYLVLNAATRYRDMLDIARQFRALAYNHLVFTKLDETSCFGSLINMITKCNVGVSYLCYGQNVPGEIQAATVESLLGLTIGKPMSKVVRKTGGK